MARKWTAIRSGSGVRRRLFAHVTVPLAGVGVILLATGLYGAWRVHRLHQRGVEIVVENVARIRRADQLQVPVREAGYQLKRYANAGNDRALHRAGDSLVGARREHREIIRSDPGVEGTGLAQTIGSAIDDFSQAFNEVKAEPEAAARRTAAAALADGPIPEAVLSGLQQYIALNDRQVDRSTRRNQAAADRLKLGLVLLGTCGGLAGLLCGYGIARRVGRSIVEVAISLHDVAGKLDEAVGPVAVTADLTAQNLEKAVQTISQRVSTVVERLQQSQRETLRAEQLAAMGRLAAGMAHEIRNPLTSMKTIVQLASDSDPHSLTHRDIRVLDEEITRLEQSVQSFLDYARPAQAHKCDIPLRDVLEQPAALVARRGRLHDIHVDCQSIGPDLRVVADRSQLRQVILNLLLNACEASSAGGTVRLTAEATAVAVSPRDSQRPIGSNLPGAPWAAVRVTDRGHGLPATLGNRIFDPFVSTKDAGTGLGLSICRRIIEDHGGTIEAHNNADGGATVLVRLPLYGHGPSEIEPTVPGDTRICNAS